MDSVTPGAAPSPSNLGDEPRSRLANADLKGNEFEGDGDQPVGRLDDERGEEGRRGAEDQPERRGVSRPRRARGTQARARRAARLHAAPRREREHFLFDRAQPVDLRASRDEPPRVVARAAACRSRPDAATTPIRRGEQHHDAGDGDLAEFAKLQWQLDSAAAPANSAIAPAAIIAATESV